MAHGPPTHFASASSTLSFSDNVIGNQVRNLSAENTLNLTEGTGLNFLPEPISQVLLFSQTVSQNLKFGDATSNLILSQSTATIQPHIVTAANILVLSQNIKRTLFNENVTSNLLLTQSIDLGQPILLSASNNLTQVELDNPLTFDPVDITSAIINDIGLRQLVTVRHSIINKSITSFLSLSQQAARTYVFSINQQIPFLQTTRVVEWEVVDQVIGITQTVVGVVSKSTTTTIALIDTVNHTLVKILTPSSSLVLSSIALPIINSKRFVYSPASIVIPLSAPTLVDRSTIVLTYPFVTPILTIDIRNPIFRNVDQISFQRINRRTRGSTLKIYRKSSWPKDNKFILSFNILKRDKVNTILEFFDKSLGKEIGLLDFETRQWKGILLTPDTLFSEIQSDQYDVSFEFEGVLA